MAAVKLWALSLMVAFVVVFLIVEHSLVAFIGVGVAVVAMAAMAWYIRGGKPGR